MHEGTYALIYQWKNQWNTFVLLHYCFFTLLLHCHFAAFTTISSRKLNRRKLQIIGEILELMVGLADHATEIFYLISPVKW